MRSLKITPTTVNLGLLAAGMALGVALAGAPATAAAQAGADGTARREAVAAFERVRTNHHREAWRLTVPRGPSHLPARYEILYHAKFISEVETHVAVRIERTPEGARGELIASDGVHRAALPRDEVDAFARAAFYMLGSTQTLRDRTSGFGGGGYASHMPERTIEIAGLSGSTFHVSTEHWQPISDELDLYASVDHVAHTLLVERFEAMLDLYLRGPVEPWSGALQAELLARLRAIPRGETLLDDYRRDDRDCVVARLLAHLLVPHLDASFVPMLDRKGLEEAAYALSLRTMPEDALIGILPRLICATDWRVESPALARTAELGGVQRRILREALGCSAGQSSFEGVAQQIEHLGPLPPDFDVLARIAHRSRDPRARTAAASLVARLGPVSTRAAAVEALFDVFENATDAMVRSDAYYRIAAVGIDEPEVAARLDAATDAALDAIPLDSSHSDQQYLVMAAVSSDPESHAAALERLTAHSDVAIVVTVIEAMERYDVHAALAAIHRRLLRFANGRGTFATFDGELFAHVASILIHDDRDALDALRRARARLPPDQDAALGLEPLERYLASQVPQERVAAILDLARARHEIRPDVREVLLARHAGDGLTAEAIDAAAAANR